jgi:iron complex outermembrane receptor protein
MWRTFGVLSIAAGFCLAASISLFAADIGGRVVDAQTGKPLGAATVQVDGFGATAMADSAGYFNIGPIDSGRFALTASHIGYKPLRTKAVTGEELTLRLQPTVLQGEEVVITSTRASIQNDAVTHSNVTREEIEREYAAQDVPMFLNSQPGVYAYSDAGNGVGYSYMQIRGFDQRKVSVLVNGVPHNDPESQQMYWVDMPDLLESATDIQIQRGVGASLYGASAAGGVVSLEVDPFRMTPGISINSDFGSYGTRKFSLEGRSGLVNGRYSLYGRYSRIVSDGYRDQSWVDMWSYFVGVARYDHNVSNRFHAYGGPENLHLAYYGIDRAQLESNRKFNPLTYEDETDTFNQPHYELLTDWQINDRLTLNNTLFYVKGDGYFLQSDAYSTFATFELQPIETRDGAAYDPWRYETIVTDTVFDTVVTGPDTTYVQREDTEFRRDTVSGDTVFFVSQYPDAVLQRWVQNDFFGAAPRFSLTHDKGVLQFGGSFDLHHGYHFGQLRSVSPAPAGFMAGQHYYDYDGRRASAIGFVQEHFNPTSAWSLTAGAQVQWRRYSLRNDRRGGVRYDVDFTSVSPRLGALYRFTPEHSGYVNLSYAQHEPAHDDIFRPFNPDQPGGLDDPSLFFNSYDSITGIASDPKMKPEKVTNAELGWRYRAGKINASANGFYEWFTDEIVDEGGIDQDGNPIRTNAGKTIHRGVEAELRFKPVKAVELSGSFTWSDNFFDEFKQYFYRDSSVQSGDTVYLPTSVLDSVDYSNNPIGGFPEIIANASANIAQPLSGRGKTVLLAGAQLRRVGRIYLDNSGNRDNSIDPYTVLDVRLGVRTGGLGIGNDFTFELLVNNVTDELYTTSGYTYGGVGYYYPAAERNYFFRVRSSW